MICPVCKQRWAPLHNLDPQYYSIRAIGLVEDERKIMFEDNEIQCCETPDCLEVVDAMLAQRSEFGTGMTYDDLVEETKKELEEGKIK